MSRSLELTASDLAAPDKRLYHRIVSPEGQLRLFLIVASLGACTTFGVDKHEQPNGGPSAADGGVTNLRDAAGGDANSPPSTPPRCSVTARFGLPTQLKAIGQYSKFGGVRLSPDELFIYFWTRERPTGSDADDVDLFVASRSNANDPFASPRALSTLNTSDDESFITLTSDGLTAYFHRGKVPSRLLFTATRTSAEADFNAPSAVPVPPIAPRDRDGDDADPWVQADGSSLFFASYGRPSTDDYQIFQISLPSTPTTPFTPLSTLNDPDSVDSDPALTADELTIFLKTTRGGKSTIYSSSRDRASIPFKAPTEIAELVSTGDAAPLWVSPDGCVLYYNVGSAVFHASRGK